MLFSSILFLLYFLPATLAIYYLVPRKNIEARNLVLLAASLLFYSWGEPVYIVLMIYSAFLNYYSALQIGRAQEKGRSGKGSMLFALFMNLLVLGFFKYFGFLMDTFNSLTGLHIHYTALSLPIGISFYTFQALSYIFDVYRKNVGPQKSFLRFTCPCSRSSLRVRLSSTEMWRSSSASAPRIGLISGKAQSDLFSAWAKKSCWPTISAPCTPPSVRCRTAMFPW